MAITPEVIEHPAVKRQVVEETAMAMPSLASVAALVDRVAKNLPWWVWLGVGGFLAMGGGGWAWRRVSGFFTGPA
jgi:hypothetical protein